MIKSLYFDLSHLYQDDPLPAPVIHNDPLPDVSLLLVKYILS